jgi:hypothetical protein
MTARAAGALLVVASAACKPAVKGLCSKQSDCRTGSYCSTDGVCLAVPPLSISVFVPPAADAVNGWVPRTSASLEVRATIDDGGAGPPRAATLSFDTCPASVPCTYPGTIVSQESGVTIFSFQVPRFAQAAGSEAPLPVTVTAVDVASNQAQGRASLQIDDAPPAIGLVTPVTAGVNGEDGRTWFAGGSGAPDVEIAVPVSDGGSGMASLTLHLTDPDVSGPDPAPVPQGDGTVHFVLSPSRVRSREGAMAFVLTAKDQLQHQSQAPGAILVDALPPSVTQPHVDYTTATPTSSTVCNDIDGSSFVCGRQAQTHILPDDKVSVFFDITDCGSGIQALSQPDAVVAGASRTFAVSQVNPASTSSCANGNRTHHYKFQLDGTKVVLPAADATATATVQLTGNAADRVGNASASAPALTGDGVALVSLWRWKRKLNGAATGAPALLPGTAGQRQVAIATDGGSVYVLPADGSPPVAQASAAGIVSDLATGASGTIYGVTSSILYIVSGGAAQSCASQGGATLGLAPIIGSWSLGSPPWAGEAALVLATSHSGTSNLFAFHWDGSKCVQDSPGTTPVLAANATEPFTGATANSTTLYAGHQKGFTSYSVASPATTSIPYAAAVVATGAPSLPSGGSTPIFTEATTPGMHLTQQATCGLTSCWNDVPAPPSFMAPAAAPMATPVFGLGAAWIVDTAGTVYGHSLSSGARLFTPVALKVPASAPALLGDGSALVVQQDCGVTVISAIGAALSLGKFCSGGAMLITPAIDDRGNGDGVAYVSTPTNWLYAVQTPAAPLPAGSSAWPRPGRDSCNSRNAGSSCQ